MPSGGVGGKSTKDYGDVRKLRPQMYKGIKDGDPVKDLVLDPAADPNTKQEAAFT